MCLEQIKPFEGRPPAYGWKVVIQINHPSHFQCQFFDCLLTVNEWNVAGELELDPEELSTSKRIDLDPGHKGLFSVFAYKKDAREWRRKDYCLRVIKVMLKGVRKVGYQQSLGGNKLRCYLVEQIKPIIR